MFDPQGKLRYIIGNEISFKRPSAVVVMEDQTFCVKDDNQLFVFDQYGTFVRKFGKDILHRPYGKRSSLFKHLHFFRMRLEMEPKDLRICI